MIINNLRIMLYLYDYMILILILIVLNGPLFKHQHDYFITSKFNITV